MRASTFSMLGAALGLAVAVPAGAADGRPEPGERGAEITIERLGDAIEAWIAWDAKLHGGSFLVRDDAREGTLVLKLDRVHRERLSALGDGEYFACADFTASDGSVYDLDIFMHAGPGSPFEGLWPTRILVHAKDGEARYGWLEEGGRWKRSTNPENQEVPR